MHGSDGDLGYKAIFVLLKLVVRTKYVDLSEFLHLTSLGSTNGGGLFGVLVIVVAEDSDSTTFYFKIPLAWNSLYQIQKVAAKTTKYSKRSVYNCGAC